MAKRNRNRDHLDSTLPKLLTPTEAAALLGVSKPVLRRMLDGGELPFYVLPSSGTVRRLIRISPTAVEKLLKACERAS